MRDLKGARVWVAGHGGLAGSAIVRRLASEPVAEVITASSAQVDLRRQDQTEAFVRSSGPDLVFLAAGRVGGIKENRDHQAEALYDNLMIAANTIEACHRAGVQKVVLLGSSCIYPRLAPQPIPESALLTGQLESTNEGYAVAKIAALELGKMYRRQYGMNVISLMPTNLYGPGDNFDLDSSHVLPALLRRFHEAKVAGADHATVWGSGKPMREFLHSDDLADAAVFAAKGYQGEEHLNVGTGEDLTISDLVQMVAEVVGWTGTPVFDTDMPDGVPRKLLDVTRLHDLGWHHRIGLREGITSTYDWFLRNSSKVRGGG